MMKMSILQIVSVIVVVTASPLFLHAQHTRTSTENTNTWFMYFGNHKFSDHFGLHAEVQWRRNDFFSKNQQVLLRTGLDYYLNNNHGRFTVGYAFIQTYPYGEFAVPNAFPEHRIWEQFLTSQKLGRVQLSHRYRLEQRMIGNASTGEFKDGRYENRMRYMAKATINISKGDRPIFLAAYDEIFLNFGEEVAYNLFDQNRLYGALGFTLSPSMKLELGYLYQAVQLRSLDLSSTPRNRIENNHTLQVALFSSLTFFKAE
jgi:hypothetical protein